MGARQPVRHLWAGVRKPSALGLAPQVCLGMTSGTAVSKLPGRGQCLLVLMTVQEADVPGPCVRFLSPRQKAEGRPVRSQGQTVLLTAAGVLAHSSPFWFNKAEHLDKRTWENKAVDSVAARK